MESVFICLEGKPEEKPLIPERQKIEDLILSLNETAQQCANMDKVIRALEDPELQKSYAFQLLDVVKEYNDTYSELLTALEELQKYEKEQDAPIDLNYRRLYKTLMENVRA